VQGTNVLPTLLAKDNKSRHIAFRLFRVANRLGLWFVRVGGGSLVWGVVKRGRVLLLVTLGGTSGPFLTWHRILLAPLACTLVCAAPSVGALDHFLKSTAHRMTLMVWNYRGRKWDAAMLEMAGWGKRWGRQEGGNGDVAHRSRMLSFDAEMACAKAAGRP
jgi:hypothetical protein